MTGPQVADLGRFHCTSEFLTAAAQIESCVGNRHLSVIGLNCTSIRTVHSICGSVGSVCVQGLSESALEHTARGQLVLVVW